MLSIFRRARETTGSLALLPGVPKAIERDRFVALDSLRGVAALGVVMFHIGNFGLIASLPLFRQGWLFVDFFFVLSGFVIAAAYGARLAHGFSRRTFLFLRLGRIYPLHFAMLMLYLAAEFTVERPVIGEEHGLGMFIRGLFLLDGYWTGLSNYYNVVSWSVSAELFAYTMAAFLFGAGRKGVAIACVLVSAAAFGQATSINVIGYSDPLQRCVLGFGAGVASFAIYRHCKPAWSTTVASLIEGGLLLLAGFVMIIAAGSDWAVLACVPVFACLIFTFAQERGALSGVLTKAPFVALGTWSYSIYMIHPFIVSTVNHGQQMLLTRSAHTELLRHGEDLHGLRRIHLSPGFETLESIIVCAIVVVAASQTYRLIEAPARHWVKARAQGAGALGAEQIAPIV